MDWLLNLFSGVSDTASALAGIGGVLGGLVSALLDVTMWRSLGWLWLGLLLLLWGVLIWTGVPQKLVSAATKIA